MNFNAFGLKATMTAAVVAGTMAIGSMPAQAAIVSGETFSFSGSAKLLDEVTETTMLDFFSTLPNQEGIVVDASDVGDDGQRFALQDILLKKTSATTWSFIGAPLTWINEPGLFKYTLQSFELTKIFDSSPIPKVTGFTAVIDGFFSPGNLGTVDGYFSSQPNLAKRINGKLKGDSFSASLTAGETVPVPTPALLPGLIGLGATAMRKKRQATAIAA
jgi:hypothetical protein